MIQGYAFYGFGKKAHSLFIDMTKSGIEPDYITFISLLNGFSHSGMVEEAISCYNSMKKEFNITPNIEHQNCVVDTLGRIGRLDEAENFIKNEIKKPDKVTWMSLLGSCRKYNDVERGERIAGYIMKLNPKDPATFVLLGNIYGAAKIYNKQEKIRKEMKEKNIKKQPGMSWIELNGKTNNFCVKDISHPNFKEITNEIKRLLNGIKERGYSSKTSWVLSDMSEEEKEEELCYHSEKLAIAFGFLNLPPEKPIRIAKNLRVCGDCHESTKWISKVFNREIIVRDANRVHIVKNGECSCGDFF